MNTKPNILIFSTFRAENTNGLNEMRHANVMQQLANKGIPHKEVIGQYGGIQEKSVLIEGFEHREEVARLAKLYNQDCYLESHGNDRFTSLVYMDGRREDLGYLQRVSSREIDPMEGFTYDLVTDSFWVTRKDR